MIHFDETIQRLRKAAAGFTSPSVSQIAYLNANRPFRVLISCLLSLRTKDEVTFPASKRLFDLAPDVHALSKLTPQEIEKIIYPVGFYRNKARQIPEICQKLLSDYHGEVPSDLEKLLEFKGVGRKTANLVRTLGHGKDGICVDTHVHRISNRLGYVKTKTPDETEFTLREVLPKKYWIEYNDLLVTWGQNVCKPVSPLCSVCVLQKECPKIGVTHSR